MEWITAAADFAHKFQAILTLALAAAGAGAFLWRWGKEARKKDLRELVPAAVELVRDFARMYKIARQGKSHPDKAGLFVKEFVHLARKRGYDPSAAEVEFYKAMGSTYHKSKKREAEEAEALAVVDAIAAGEALAVAGEGEAPGNSPPGSAASSSGSGSSAAAPTPPATTSDALED